MDSLPKIGIVIPVFNEEECLGAVLDELPKADRFVVAVGLNANTDRSKTIARERGALVGETQTRGYGHGCMAAIEVLPEVDGYLFWAGDGASDPADIPALLEAFDAGNELVLGNRTTSWENWRRPLLRIAANLVLGLWTTFLSGRFYVDLGPTRIISRQLFEKMALTEMTYGWTIEPQILAPRLGARTAHVRVAERRRIAGQQKISGVSLRQTIQIGLEIAAAGWRASRRDLG